MLTRLHAYSLELCIRDFTHRGAAIANELTKILSAFSLTDLNISSKNLMNCNKVKKTVSSSTGPVLSHLS